MQTWTSHLKKKTFNKGRRNWIEDQQITEHKVTTYRNTQSKYFNITVPQ